MPRQRRTPQPYVKAGRLAVCLRDPATGHRRTVYLGEPGSPEALRTYARVLAEWEDAGRGVAPTASRIQLVQDQVGIVSVAELVLRYHRDYVKTRHSDAGKLTSHGRQIRDALRWLRIEAGDTAAADFGPRAPRRVRAAMAESGRLGRKVVNRYAGFMVRAFRWAVSEEVVDVAVYDALRTLEPLKAGEVSGLRESKRIRPVSDQAVEATLPHLPTPVRGIVEVMRLTGARCGEVTQLRPIDIDTTGKVWRAELTQHKTAHHGRPRVLLFGPRAQEVLRPFLSRDLSAPLFSPVEAVAELFLNRRKARTASDSCGNRPGTNRVPNPRKEAGDQYTTYAVGQAIARACRAAFPAPEKLIGAELKTWHDEHRWTAHQLRHIAATRIRQAGGLDAAAVVLGHSSATLTDAVYAERDEKNRV